jgi:hypothetical protein
MYLSTLCCLHHKSDRKVRALHRKPFVISDALLTGPRVTTVAGFFADPEFLHLLPVMAIENGFSSGTTTGVDQDGLVMPVSNTNAVGGECECSGG